MKNIGMSREEAVTKLEDLWAEWQQLSAEMQARFGSDDWGWVNNPERMKLDSRRAKLSGMIDEIRISGVIPWRVDGMLSSVQPDSEVWCTRSMMRYGDVPKVLVLAVESRNTLQRTPLTREQAEELLRQLSAELGAWEDE